MTRGASATGARRNGNTGSRGGGGGGGDGARTATKKAVQADGVAKVVNGLKGELAAAAETAMEKLEAGCDAFGEWTKLVQRSERESILLFWPCFVCVGMPPRFCSLRPMFHDARHSRRGGVPYECFAVRSGSNDVI